LESSSEGVGALAGSSEVLVSQTLDVAPGGWPHRDADKYELKAFRTAVGFIGSCARSCRTPIEVPSAGTTAFKSRSQPHQRSGLGASSLLCKHCGERAEVRRRLIGQQLGLESPPSSSSGSEQHEHLPPRVGQGGDCLLLADVQQLRERPATDEVNNTGIEGCRPPGGVRTGHRHDGHVLRSAGPLCARGYCDENSLEASIRKEALSGRCDRAATERPLRSCCCVIHCPRAR
jgi:hypothetical protein